MMSNPKLLRTIAYAVTLLALAAFVVFGHRYHWLEVADSAERDGFVAKAELILQGRLPLDAYRPPLYPILTAGLAYVFGHPFAMARLLSNLAAAGLLLCAFGLACKLRGEAAGLWALVLTGVNANVWTFGQETTTDVLFACLAACTLLAGLTYLRRPSLASAVCAGMAYGAAAFTRSNAMLLLPALGLAWYWAAPANGVGRRSWRHALAGAACAVAILLPLWLLRVHSFGAPFYDENYKNLWWKLHGNGDWSQLDRAPYTSLSSLLLSEPVPVARAAVAEVVRFTRAGFPGLVGGWGVGALFALAAVSALRARRRPSLFLLFAIAVFAAGVATVFFARNRFMLLLIPLSAALISAEMSALADALEDRRARVIIGVLGFGLVCFVFAKTLTRDLPAFVARHPYAELAALRRVERDLPSGAKLAGTSRFLGRYLDRDYVAVPDALGGEARNAELYLQRLEELLRTQRVAYLVVSRVELRGRPPCLLAQGEAECASWLRLTQRESDVTTWEVVPR